MMKTALSVENLSKVYFRDKKKGSKINALNNITLEVKQGEVSERHSMCLFVCCVCLSFNTWQFIRLLVS